MTSRLLTRADVLAATRRWLGTPYHHQASVRGVGTDCLGLVRGVWRDLYDAEPEPPPPYTSDWAEATATETLRDAAARHLVPISVADARPGDVLLFRLRADCPAKHAGLLAAPALFIHAMEAAAVVEAPLLPWWRRRIAAAFAFPGVTD